MQVSFRIEEIKNQAGEIVFVPERLYIPSIFYYSPAGQKKPEEQWVNITEGFGNPWYATFDSARDRIKEYVEKNNINKPVDVIKIHLMPEFTYITEDPKPNCSPEVENKIKEFNIKGEKLKKKIAEIETKRPPITQEELDRLAEWLKSDEGRKIIKEAQNKADAVCRIIDSMNDIDPKILKEPFNI